MIKAVIFDLDGTLLPMDEEEFTKGYFNLLCKKLVPLGYNKDELVQTVWAGTKAMVKNDGQKTNEQIFWDCFKNTYGDEKIKDKKVFDDFYVSDFKNTICFCKQNPWAKKIVQYAKNLGLKTILASNPLFPISGMTTRMEFVGLKQEDFDYTSSYETSHYAKPNPKFYQEILDNLNLKSNEVIYFCNSEKEDVVPAQICKIKTYLIGDNISLLGENNLQKYTYQEVEKIIYDNLKQ